MGLMHAARTAAAVVLLAVLGACGDPEPDSSSQTPSDVPTTTADPEPTTEQRAPAAAPLVPGTGAGLAPQPIDQWCAAITREQLTALMGIEIEEVRSTSYVGGGEGCSATPLVEELSDPSFVIDWKADDEDSLEPLRAELRGSATPVDVRDVTLRGGQPALTARMEPVRSTVTAAVVDGRVVRASFLEPYGSSTSLTLDDYARFTEAIVAVHAG